MKTNVMLLLPTLTLPAGVAQAGPFPQSVGPVTELYRIDSGMLTTVGGWATWEFDLSEDGPWYIELTLDQYEHSAEMTLLDPFMEPLDINVFLEASFVEGRTDGRLVHFAGDRLQGWPVHFDYRVVMQENRLTLDGEIRMHPFVDDGLSFFGHSSVHATVIPEPATLSLLAIGLGAVLIRRRWEAA